MSLKLNKDDFIKMANKIYIQPTNEVIEYIEKEVNFLNDHIDLLQQIDVTNVEPLTRISQPITFLREDEIDENIYLDKKVLLDNAKEKDRDFVIIKRIFKE